MIWYHHVVPAFITPTPTKSGGPMGIPSSTGGGLRRPSARRSVARVSRSPSVLIAIRFHRRGPRRPRRSSARGLNSARDLHAPRPGREQRGIAAVLVEQLLVR